MTLSADSILKHAGSFETKEVHVPAWKDENGDDTVLVRGMTIREFELTQSRAQQGLNTASTISRCVVDATGARVFSDEQVGQIAELGLNEISKLDMAIAELSGMTDKAVDEPGGNSPAAQSGNSSSDSPETSE